MKIRLGRIPFLFHFTRLLGLAGLGITFFSPLSQRVRIVTLILGVVFLALSAHLDYNCWRCVHCGTHLGNRMLPFPKRCPHCGARPLKSDVSDYKRWRLK